MVQDMLEDDVANDENGSRGCVVGDHDRSRNGTTNLGGIGRVLKACESLFPFTYNNVAAHGAAAAIAARPLFYPSPDKSGAELGRVIAALSDKLRVLLSDLAREPQHDELLVLASPGVDWRSKW